MNIRDRYRVVLGGMLLGLFAIWFDTVRAQTHFQFDFQYCHPSCHYDYYEPRPHYHYPRRGSLEYHRRQRQYEADRRWYYNEHRVRPYLHCYRRYNYHTRSYERFCERR